MWGRGIGLVVAPLVVAGACSSGTDSPRSAPPAAPGVPALEALAIDASQHDAALNAALQRVLEPCMAAQGFSAPPLAALAPLDPDDVRPRHIGLESAADLAALDEPVAPGASNSPPAGVDLVAYDQALFGDERDRVETTVAGGLRIGRPRSGCMAQASDAVHGQDQDRLTELNGQIRQLRGEADGAALVTAEVRDAITAWARCMHDQGIAEATEPKAVLDELHRRRSASGLTPTDRRLAQTDLTCKASTDLPAVVGRAVARAHDDAVRRHPGVIDEYRALTARTAERVAAILAR